MWLIYGFVDNLFNAWMDFFVFMWHLPLLSHGLCMKLLTPLDTQQSAPCSSALQSGSIHINLLHWISSERYRWWCDIFYAFFFNVVWLSGVSTTPISPFNSSNTKAFGSLLDHCTCSFLKQPQELLTWKCCAWSVKRVTWCPLCQQAPGTETSHHSPKVGLPVHITTSSCLHVRACMCDRLKGGAVPGFRSCAAPTHWQARLYQTCTAMVWWQDVELHYVKCSIWLLHHHFHPPQRILIPTTLLLRSWNDTRPRTLAARECAI